MPERIAPRYVLDCSKAESVIKKAPVIWESRGVAFARAFQTGMTQVAKHTALSHCVKQRACFTPNVIRPLVNVNARMIWRANGPVPFATPASADSGAASASHLAAAIWNMLSVM